MGSSCSFIFVRFTQKHSVETGSRAIGKPARMELQWLNLLVKKTSKMLAGALQDKGREKFRKSRRLQKHLRVSCLMLSKTRSSRSTMKHKFPLTNPDISYLYYIYTPSITYIKYIYLLYVIKII